MGAKTDTAEYERRIEQVMELIAAGARRAAILQFVAEKTEWDVCERTVDNYIKAANKRFAKVAEHEREIERGKARRRLEMIFSKAMQVQDYARAIAAQRELNQLLGLYEPKQLDVNNSGSLEIVIREHAADYPGLPETASEPIENPV